MNGKVVLWVPGTDHAGIATQSVVERALLKKGLTRHELGREKFVAEVWKWKEEYGNTICNQLRRVASSVSWPHFSFTLDKKLSRAVTEAFVRLYDRGLIFRAERLVTWSPYLKTAISDIEVDVDEIDKPTKINIPGFQYPVDVGYLWHFWYEVEGTKDRLQVATTRIETMLGDVAVAVNPTDSRYKDLVGKRLIHPFFPDRKMVVVADEHVDPTFGTGAVKITPAHDKNDYDMAKRHNLPSICVFTLDGYISKEGGPFAGQHRFECRHNIQKALKDLGLLGDRVPNTRPMQLPRCSRSGDTVEYMLIPQWWCSCKDMAASAVQKVRDGDLQIIPATYKDVWFHWLENIKDWCVSRQLWWGHRIPAYKVVKPEQKTETWVVGRNKEEALSRACTKLGLADPADIELEQDEDVLDTWFSSGLFPFSVFGWPEDTPELKAYFPTTLLETVFLHAMVRDAHGQKMSKSKGNVIDPLEVIHGISLEDLQKKLRQGNLPEKEIKRAQEVLKKEFPNGIGECGCDALRMGLLAYTRQGRSVNLDLNRVVGYRHFCNKLWNATKFALDKFARAESIIYGTSHEAQAPELGNGDPAETRCADAFATKKASQKMCFIPEGIGFSRNARKDQLSRAVVYEDLQWIDRWILHRLATTCAEVEKAFMQYAFADVVTSIFSFFLYDFCDYYVEVVKMRLVTPPSCPSRDQQIASVCALEVLHTCLDKSLRLLHPICPFITEELFQRLPGYVGKPESITLADYPQAPLLWLDCKLTDNMALFKLIVSRFRSLAAALDIPPKLKPAGYISVAASAVEASSFLAAHESELAVMANMSRVDVRGDDFVGERCVSDVVTGSARIYMSVEEGVNLTQTCQKLRKKKLGLEKLNENSGATPDLVLTLSGSTKEWVHGHHRNSRQARPEDAHDYSCNSFQFPRDYKEQARLNYVF
ncbi:UNVERIFIED_CONTAM: hypothetical protein H355_005464 [Colinus virginianus]|nr:hypothetical protein H355_005464 [Colinus virginianus]